MRFVRKNFASLKPEDINERTLIVDTARGQYPWLNKEVAEVITDIIELAPTEELHQKFQARKSEFKEQGLTNGIAHYKAFTATDYEEEFREEFDDDLVQDLIDNEFADYDTIIFSCWCASNSPCHTDILVDMFSKAVETTEQVTLFESSFVDEEEEVPQYTKGIKSAPWTSTIPSRIKGITSVYNPKYTSTYLGQLVRPAIPLLKAKPEPKMYGGLYKLPTDEANPKSLGRVDSKGNYITCTPKQTGINKNRAAKQRTKFLVGYSPDPDAVFPESRKCMVENGFYTAEYGLTEIREAYNGGANINTRYSNFIRLTASEKASREAGRRGL